jgi:hypothetical protein
MDEIRTAVKRAAWRLYVLDVFATLCVMVTVGAIALVVVRVVDALFIVQPDWWAIFALTGAASVAVALAWSLVRRARGIEVARELDERAELREALSTAMCVAGRNDPWSRAVVESARERARQVNVRASIPYVAPRLLPAPIVALIALGVIWFSLPEHFTFTTAAKEHQRRQEVQQVRIEAETFAKEIEKLVGQDKAAELKEEAPEGGDVPEAVTADQIRQREIKQITALHTKLSEEAQSEQAQTLKAAEKIMRQLKQPGPGPLDSMTRELQQGNFQKAREELTKLAEQMNKGDLNEEQRAALRDQLQKLAEQLEKLGQNQQDLERQLQQAGLSPEQAKQAGGDPQILDEMLSKMENLSEQEKQALKDLAQAQRSASQMCRSMSEAMNKMAGACNNPGGMGQEGMKGLEGMAGQLSELEMLQADMMNLQDAIGKCQAQLAALGNCLSNGQCNGGALQALWGNTGQWKAGDSSQFGKGSGAAGKGYGVGPEEQRAPFDLESTKANTHRSGGPVIGTKLVEGESIRGESTQEMVAVAVTSSQRATEAIERREVPLEFAESVRKYFGSVEEASKEAAGGDGK